MRLGIITMHINEDVKDILSRHGFNSYNQFIEYKGGSLVSRVSKRTVRTLEISVKGRKKFYFIKQAKAEPFKRVLQSIKKGRCPHSKVFKELKILKFFEEHKVPVMRVAGWGEERFIGWPVSGFLLVEKVEGKEFVEMFKMAGSKLRKQMMKAYGSLVGHLHKIGINSKVRPRDIICTSDDFSAYSSSMVIIDREHGNPYIVNMTLEKCALQLAMILTKSIHNIGILGKFEIFAFLNGYFNVNSALRNHRIELINIALDKIKYVVSSHERYKDIRDMLLKKYQLIEHNGG